MRCAELALREVPRSGKPKELLDRLGLSVPHIVAAAKVSVNTNPALLDSLGGRPYAFLNSLGESADTLVSH